MEFAGGAGDVNSARRAALTVFHPLHNAGWLGTLRTIRALGGVHFFLAISGFGNLGHVVSNLLQL